MAYYDLCVGESSHDKSAPISYIQRRFNPTTNTEIFVRSIGPIITHHKEQYNIDPLSIDEEINQIDANAAIVLSISSSVM